MTLREANADGDATLFSLGLDAGIIGLDGIALSAGHLTLEAENNHKATELDLTVSYAFSDNLSIDLIYSDIDDDIKGDTFKNTRIFVNYLF